MTDSTFDITTSLSEPFFEGGGTTPDEWSMPVGIDGRGFLLDLASDAFQRRSVDLLNTQDSRSGTTDQASVPPEVWRRVMESWHQGADQARFDREDSLPYRFNRSVGIDPWKRYGFELLNDVKNILPVPAGQRPFIESIGRTLLVVIGRTAYLWADVIAADASWVETDIGSTVVGTCADGENFYTLTTDGTLSKCVAATGVFSTLATVASFNPAKAMLAFVKGFILVGNGPKLLDYTNPAGPVEVFTHRLSGWWWRAASEGLSVIYILGGMGDRWHVHRVGIKNTGAGLDPPIVAATLPEGEVGYALGTYLGYVLIGVSTGWRFGMPEASGAVTYGQLVETPAPVQCFEGQDRFVWFGLSLGQGQAAQQRVIDRTIYTDFAGLGRADLSTFVAPMTPAAASDLRGAGTGVTTDVVTMGNDTDGIGYRVFGVQRAGATGGIYLETDNKVETGVLRSGTLSFNSNDEKMGLYLQAFHEPLAGAVTVRVGNDRDSTPAQIGFNNRPDSVSVENMPYPVSFHAAEIEVELRRDATNHERGPRVSRLEFRAVNVPGRATEWQIPLLLHDDLNYSNIERTFDVRESYDFLMELVQTRRPFVYREGERQWRLHATDFLWRPYKMNGEGTTYQGTFILVAREYL